MDWICIFLAALAGLCLYLASPHQALVPRWQSRLQRGAGMLRVLAAGLAVAAFASASGTVGPAVALFVSLAGLMMALVTLPYLAAWLHRRRAARGGRDAR